MRLFMPCHTHNGGVSCSNQGVATIFRLLRTPIAALDLFAKRSRTNLYCSRYREKVRLALGALATAKTSRGSGGFKSGRSQHFFNVFAPVLTHLHSDVGDLQGWEAFANHPTLARIEIRSDFLEYCDLSFGERVRI